MKFNNSKIHFKFQISNFKLRKLFTGIVVFGLIGAVFLRLTTPKVEAGWFDDSWEYRKGVSIASHTSAENNVYVTVPAFDATDTSRFQSDCGNLRFTDQNGKSLQYFAVDCDATANVNVLFDTLPAGSSNYYMYYGNLNAPDGFASANFATAASNLGSQTAGSEETTPGPISYWRFDEGSGNASDATLQANTLTVTNAVRKTPEFCASDGCLFFDGTTDYAAKTYSTDTELDPGTGSFSVSMWFKHNSTTPGSNQFALARFLSGGYKIYMNTSGNMCFGIDSDATWTPSDTACGTTNLADSQWHHLTAVKSGTSTITIYIDGQQPVTVPITDTTSLSGSSPVFNVGIDTGQGSGGWVGFLDEVKYYNFAKTADQVKTEFAARSTSKGVTASFGPDTNKSLSSGLVGYWKLDENTGVSASDASGNGNTGTLTNSPDWSSGKFGPGLTFRTASANDNYVTVPYSSVFDMGSGFSVSYWMKMTSTWDSATTQRNTGIVGRSSESADYSTESDWAFFLFNANGSVDDDDGRMRFGTYGGNIQTNTSTWNGGQWYHIAVTYTTSTDARIYVNGKLDNYSGDYDAGSVDGTADNPLLIGYSFYDGTIDGNFGGTVDDVRIYSRAITPSEVEGLYNFAPGPIGWWKLDDNTGTSSTTDSSGNGLTGSFTGSPVWTVGKFGSALSFDGSSQAVTATLSADPGYSNSVELWVYPTLSLASKTIVTNLTTNSSSQPIYGSCTGTAISLNTWTHIAATSTDSTHCAIYQNGILTVSSSTTGVTFGTSVNIAASSFSGNTDDVRIYNYARNPKQIIEDMNAGHPVGGSPVASQTLYYKFDEQNGSTINNSGYGTPTTATSTGIAWLLENNCKLNGCLNFDTTTDNVAATDPSFFDGIATMSATFWINPQTLTASRSIMSKSNTNQETFRIETWSTSSELKVTISNALTDTSNYYATQGLGLTTSAWQHIAVIYDAGDISNPVKVYRNAVKSGGGVTGTIPYGLRASTSNFRIGQSVGAVSALLAYIDEPKIYAGVALSPSDIAIDMNAGSSAALGGVLGTHDSEGFSLPNLIGWWKMDDNTGTTTIDSSGNGNTGTLTAGPTWATGKIGAAINFDGNNDGISTTQAFDAANPWSVAFWVYPRTLSTDDTFFSTLNLTTAIYVGNGANRNLSLINGGNSFIGTSSNNVLTVNVWQHVAVTYDGSGTAAFYVNSQNVTSSSTVEDTADTNNISIGGYDGEPAYTFTTDGIIDDFRYFRSTLTPAQIAYIYNRGAPVAWYKFDECQGATAYNAAPAASGGDSGLDGTITIGASGDEDTVGDCTTSSTAWGNGATGKYNSSLDFDGTDDYVTYNDTGTSNLDISSSFTLNAWVNFDALSTAFQTILFKSSATTNSNYLIITDTGANLDEIDCGFWDSSQGTLSPSSINLTTNRWYHLACVFDDSANTVTLFVDGIQNAQLTGVTNSPPTGDGDLFIGEETTSYGANGLDGQIDDVRIYNYALTATQIKTLYNEGSAVRFGPQTGSP